ncbi:arylsulfatase [Thermostilla marina]
MSGSVRCRVAATGGKGDLTMRRILGVLVFLAAGWFSVVQAAKPDLLLIMPDQMRGDCLSCLGHPVVETPTFDRLAREGVLFRRAYATVPSCIPARYALLTGLYPQTSGVVGFRQKPVTRPTMPQLLTAQGYLSILVGRTMHQRESDEALGYTIHRACSTYVRGDEYAKAIEAEFDEIREFHAWVTDTLGLSYNLWPARAWPIDESWHPTVWIVRTAEEVLAEIPDDRPVFLTASFYAPHPPLFPPPQYFDKYMQADLPAPAHGDWVDWDALTPQGAEGGHRVLLTGETLRRAQAGYFGLIEQLDREVASLVQAFVARAEKAGRPWLIAVTSDHGEMLGDHGYFRKCEPLEGSANVPMILAGSPELKLTAGTRIDRPVCLEDLLPTFLDAAGAAPPEDIDGVSLLPAARGKDTLIRPWLHFEHAPCYSKAQAFHALTDGRIKYIWRPTDGSELLFDLVNDPKEEHNLADDPTHAETLRHWRSILIERLARRPEGFTDGKRLIPGRPYPALNDGVPPAE